MIYGIDGQFGSGKTSLAVKIAFENQSPNTIIWTNIKMNTKKIKNVIYFPDDQLLSVLRMINLVNDVERLIYGINSEKSNLVEWERSKFTKNILLFDEAGAVANGRDFKNFDNTATEYLNQNRKNFLDIYLITPDGDQVDKSLRRHAESWYYSKPLVKWIPFFKDIKIVRLQKRDKDGSVKMQHYLGKDPNGDYIKKERPMDWFEKIYYQPFVYPLYDDLHKNIKDPDKYNSLDMGAIFKYFEKNPLFLEKAKDKEEFKTLFANQLLTGS